MFSNKPVAIILGGSIPHIPLIENLKQRGYYCILFDYLENPKAKNIADEHHLISILDKENVLEGAKKYSPKTVINLCFDRAITTATYVSEKLGLHTPYNYHTAELITNKLLMKDVMIKNNIPTSQYVLLEEQNRDNSKLKPLTYPLIVKPIDSTGSLGVVKVDKEDDLEKAIETAFQYSREKKLIIEEFVGGEEWNMYFFIDNGVPKLQMVLQKVKHDDENAGLQQVGSYVIPENKNIILAQVKQLAHQVVKAFNLNMGPLLIQAKVDNDTFSVIEIAARLGGTALSNAMLKKLKNIDIVDVSVSAYLNEPVVIKEKECQKVILSNFIYAQSGVFKEIQNLDSLKNAGTIEEFFILKNSGDTIPEGITSKNRVGAYYVLGENLEDAMEKIKIAANAIDVLGENNQSIYYKNIYVK